jgi:hypothetical protein
MRGLIPDNITTTLLGRWHPDIRRPEVSGHLADLRKEKASDFRRRLEFFEHLRGRSRR